LIARPRPQLLLGAELQRLRREIHVSDVLIRAMDQAASAGSRTLGGCERIAGTAAPVPADFIVL
jgi:predicted membrane chloride channel (bestrophin family)